MLDRSVIREIHSRVDIATVIGNYVSLKKRGNDLVGLCPFHGEKTPSMHVHPDRGFFKCFGCGVGGDVLTFTNRQLWWSQHDPDFKELLDTRGKNDVESPLGEWTRVEVRCEGKRIAVSVNGTLINECYDVFPAAGKILLQCEGFELDVRKFELRALKTKE